VLPRAVGRARPSVQYLVPASLRAIRCALVRRGVEVFGKVLEDRFGSGDGSLICGQG